jgi:hypothetical protein
MNMEGGTMHGVGGMFNEAVCHRDEEGYDGSCKFENMNADFGRITAFTQIQG